MFRFFRLQDIQVVDTQPLEEMVVEPWKPVEGSSLRRLRALFSEGPEKSSWPPPGPPEPPGAVQALGGSFKGPLIKGSFKGVWKVFNRTLRWAEKPS